MASIELVNIHKTLRDPGRPRIFEPPALRGASAPRHTQPFSLVDINIRIPDRTSLVILGPSGCGKSTLLRIIAGLIPPDSGQVLFDGQDVTSQPPAERQIGMVFQNYALYPHYTAKTNILSYFMFRKKSPAMDALSQARYARTSQLMGVELAHLLERMPPSLSAGEKQRVALARCITREPRLFLMDEPFSNLDQRLREKYRSGLKTLLREFQITSVYVTHDQHEALVIADVIAIMEFGRIVQTGSYRELYEKPTNLFVAEFLNPSVVTHSINVIDGAAVASEFNGQLLGVRPEDFSLAPDHSGLGLDVVIEHIFDLPAERQQVITARHGEIHVQARLPAAPPLHRSQEVRLRLSSFHVFARDNGRRIRTVYSAEQGRGS